MEIISIATLGYLLFILAGWVYRSGRSLSELKFAPTLKLTGSPDRRGRVSVLIPAKNEEKNIADCVRPFLSQLRDGDELIVINNCSTDKTEEILNELGAVEILGTGSVFLPHHKILDGSVLWRKRGQAPFPAEKEPVPGKTVPVPLFRYLNTPPTPEGWTGKNFALHLGMEHASGDWLLFTDADTRHEHGSLNATLSFAEERKLDLLTLLPRCIASSFWEEMIQPCAMGYMGLWFPIRKINDPRSKVYFGNGQYLLLRAGHYRIIEGHESVKESFLEDFALMKKTKQTGARGMCAFGMEVYGTRMYDSLGALWRGWRRIFLHAFEEKPAPILKCALSVFFFSVFPFMVFFALLHSFSTSLRVYDPIGSGTLLLCVLILGITLATAATAYAIVRARKRYAVLHPLAALIFTGILLDAFQMAFFKRRTLWR